MIETVITSDLPDAIERRLKTEFGARKLCLQQLGAQQFLKDIGAPDALVVIPGDPVNAALINQLPDSVKHIASYSTGLDHVDVKAAADRGISVSNTPDVLTDATADLAMLLILATVRGAEAATQKIRAGRWTGWSAQEVFGQDLYSQTLGVYGPGRIGVATARRAKAFGMTSIYWGRRRSSEMAALGAMYVPYEKEFFSIADIVSLHVPSTPQTRQTINATSLSWMKAGSYIVNTGRGDLVDDDALIDALNSGHIAGAGLDVFNNEPELDTRYLALNSVFALPHIGSATVQTRRRMGESVLASLANVATTLKADASVSQQATDLPTRLTS